MANFNKPADWGVASSNDWVSKDTLKDRGAPRLGDPSYAERADEECYSEDFDEGDFPSLTKLDPVIAGGRMVKVCPPGQKRQNGICVPNVKSEASPQNVAKWTASTKPGDDEDEDRLNKGKQSEDLDKDSQLKPSKWALSTLPLQHRDLGAGG